MVWVGQLLAVVELVALLVCSAGIGPRVNPDDQAEPLKMSPWPTVKRSMPGSLQQEVVFPPAEQHQLLSLQRYSVLVTDTL